MTALVKIQAAKAGVSSPDLAEPRYLSIEVARTAGLSPMMRIDKGHTEGLEPKVTEELIKLIIAARGGKIQKGG